ncbi:hypothetical protein DCAR_0727141 [Daucus carota subsp. sativus]|uniref:Uncharacterized protein n=1 Tax=Daucus carota subsp. sativus TaxID=79200 RepID=A0AAF0XGV8_DAUCS|nr:hypothetical protein DCAR_0727141 [Daucus carota subsp. sativus]
MSAGLEVVAVSAFFGFLVSFGAGFAGLVSCCRHPFVTVSMRLRPKRTCSGVECFGGFVIMKYFYLFLFLRGPFT